MITWRERPVTSSTSSFIVTPGSMSWNCDRAGDLGEDGEVVGIPLGQRLAAARPARRRVTLSIAP